MDEIKAKTTAGPSAPAPTTWGIPALLAKALDDAEADFTTGMKVYDENLHNLHLVLHEPPRVVLEALFGNSIKSGIGDLHQHVLQRISNSSAVVHWARVMLIDPLEILELNRGKVTLNSLGKPPHGGISGRKTAMERSRGEHKG